MLELLVPHISALVVALLPPFAAREQHGLLIRTTRRVRGLLIFPVFAQQSSASKGQWGAGVLA